MAFISITRLKIRSIRFMPLFLWLTLRSHRQAKRAPGSLAVSLYRDRYGAFWMATSWESETAMRAFMTSGPHRKAMPKLLDWCDEAAVVHWTQEGTELPDWREAHRRMVTEGRRSKVRHPSPAQVAYEIPIP